MANTFQEDLLQLIIRHEEEFSKPLDPAKEAQKIVTELRIWKVLR